MGFTGRASSDILTQILQELRSTGISYTHKSSKAYGIASAMSRELETTYNFFNQNFDAVYLRNASGELLEALGELFGLRRRQPSKCFSLSTEFNVQFYTDEANFGAINGGQDIIVPAGTIIQTRPLVGGQDPIQYEVTSSATLPASESTWPISVSALNEGSSSRVGPTTLTVHDFVQYADFVNDTLRVVNSYGIVNGEDRQSDEDYRFLISQVATASQAGNSIALRFAAYSVPGVEDVRVINYFDGIGTVGVFVAGQDNNITPYVTNLVQQSVNQYQSNGILATAYAPVQVGISWSTKVNTTTTLTINAQNELRQKLIEVSRSYIANLRIGDSADLTGLKVALLQSDDRIVSFGTGTNFFDQLGLWRTSIADVTQQARTRSEYLNQTTFEIRAHEIVIPELSLTSPLTFTF